MLFSFGRDKIIEKDFFFFYKDNNKGVFQTDADQVVLANGLTR